MDSQEAREFIITTKEVYKVRYTVSANNKKEAIKFFKDGDGCEAGMEYLCPLEDITSEDTIEVTTNK